MQDTEDEYSRVSETLQELSLRDRLHNHSRYGLFAFDLDRAKNHSVVDRTVRIRDKLFGEN